MARFQILSFDGGGVRGVFSAVILQRLCDAHPNLLSSTNLFAGTSTGGLLALGVAHGFMPEAVVTLYREHAPEIFSTSLLGEVRKWGSVLGSRYENKALRSVLRGMFGTGLTLGQIKRNVLIPAFDLDNLDRKAKQGERRYWKAKFFHNFPEGDQDDRKELVVDVALRTTAAPTYFPAVNGFVDGGVVANNPSMAALAQALHPVAGSPALSDIRLLSIGSGRTEVFVPGKNLDWGVLQWARPAIQIMLEGSMGVADFQCAQILGEKYLRVDPWLPAPVNMDDKTHVDRLISEAEQAPLDDAIEWLGRAWDFELQPSAAQVAAPARKVG